jgi:predicted metal-dependent hydrolase
MSDLNLIFQQEYRNLRPRAPMPEFYVEFFSFTGINNTIRLREGQMKVRLSDLLEGAPESVLRAIAHILLAKIYRKPIDRLEAQRYRRHITSRDLVRRAEQVRAFRGRKHIAVAQGKVYDLNELFDQLNQRYFWGLLARPQMTWSRDHARASLGHYDPAHNAIVVSRIFDSPRVPRPVVEYLVFHEMLHLKHPVKVRHGRRCVHSREFQAEEKLFAQLEQAKMFLKML